MNGQPVYDRVMAKPTCPRCGRPGGVQMLLSVAPCDGCVAAGDGGLTVAAERASSDPVVSHVTKACGGPLLNFDKREIEFNPTLRPANLDLGRAASTLRQFEREYLNSPAAPARGAAATRPVPPGDLGRLHDRLMAKVNADVARGFSTPAQYVREPAIATLDPDRDFPDGVIYEARAAGADEVKAVIWPAVTDGRLDARPEPARVTSVTAALYAAGYTSVDVQTVRIPFLTNEIPSPHQKVVITAKGRERVHTRGDLSYPAARVAAALP